MSLSDKDIVGNGWKYVIMHITTMACVCFLVARGAETAITIGIMSGWFGFISGDKLQHKHTPKPLVPTYGSQPPISEPSPVRKL